MGSILDVFGTLEFVGSGAFRDGFDKGREEPAFLEATVPIYLASAKGAPPKIEILVNKVVGIDVVVHWHEGDLSSADRRALWGIGISVNGHDRLPESFEISSMPGTRKDNTFRLHLRGGLRDFDKEVGMPLDYQPWLQEGVHGLESNAFDRRSAWRRKDRPKIEIALPPSLYFQNVPIVVGVQDSTYVDVQGRGRMGLRFDGYTAVPSNCFVSGEEVDVEVASFDGLRIEQNARLNLHRATCRKGLSTRLGRGASMYVNGLATEAGLFNIAVPSSELGQVTADGPGMLLQAVDGPRNVTTVPVPHVGDEEFSRREYWKGRFEGHVDGYGTSFP